MVSIADRMYGEVDSELWSKLATGLEGLQWIVSSFEFLRFLYDSDILNRTILSNYCTDLENIVKELEIGLTENDLVAAADLFKYELLPCLEKYQNEFGKLKVES
ncbi:hypothetical protein D3C76_1172680 [compost metagenome]